MAAPTVYRQTEIKERIARALDADPDQPYCVHRLCQELLVPAGFPDEDRLQTATEIAAEQLAREGKARVEHISTASIGVSCQDSLYWSTRAPQRTLADFGPEYESPAILHRLASHIRCQGL